MHIQIRGEGKPLLFLHGYLSCKESFAYQTAYFCKSFKTVAPDLPGFGEAQEPPYAFSLSDYEEYALGIINEHCGGKADIIAHSFGGRIALKLAADHPEAVGKMLLAGCAGMKPRRRPAYYIKTGAYKALKRLCPPAAAKWEQKYSSSDYLALSPLMRISFKKIIAENLEGILKDISAETLLVFGENDSETPLYMAKRLNRGIRGSGLAVMKKCGHFTFSERPAEFNAVAEEFFLN